MNAFHPRHLVELCRVRIFVDGLLGRFKMGIMASVPPTDLGAAPEILAHAITAIRACHAQHQATAEGAREAAKDAAFLREQLWLQYLSRAAIVVRFEFPHLSQHASFAVPRRDCSMETLIRYASTIADLIAGHQDRLTKAGMPKNAAHAVRSFATAIAAKLEAQQRFRGAAAAERVAMVANLRLGRHAVRLIDHVLKPAYADRPAMRSLWNNTKQLTPERFERLVAARQNEVQ